MKLQEAELFQPTQRLLQRRHCRHLLWTKKRTASPEDASAVVLCFAIPGSRDLPTVIATVVTPALVVTRRPFDF